MNNVQTSFTPDRVGLDDKKVLFLTNLAKLPPEMTPVTPQWSGWKSEIHWISSAGIQSDAQWYLFASGCSFSSIHIHTKAKNGQKSHFSVQFGAEMAPMSHRWGISKFENCSRRSGGLYSNPQIWLIVLKRWFRSITWHFLAKNSILGHFQYIFYT